MAENCIIEVTLVSMGPLAERGPGQIAPVVPPLGGPVHMYVPMCVVVCMHTHIHFIGMYLEIHLKITVNIINFYSKL